MTTTPKSDFDAIAMKRQAARRIHEYLQGKDTKERLDYWNERTESLRQKQEEQRASS
jgi:hypothetical protein